MNLKNKLTPYQNYVNTSYRMHDLKADIMFNTDILDIIPTDEQIKSLEQLVSSQDIYNLEIVNQYIESFYKKFSY